MSFISRRNPFAIPSPFLYLHILMIGKNYFLIVTSIFFSSAGASCSSILIISLSLPMFSRHCLIV